MSPVELAEVDRLEALVIIDNELDPLSPVPPNTVQITGHLGTMAVNSPHELTDRGDACKEIHLGDICCSAHGLSVLVTATKGDIQRSVLFDVGPDEDVWERNVKRLRPDLASIDLVLLSHWHRDHSGGMLRAIRMINEAKAAQKRPEPRLTIDLHPSRPDYRGFSFGDKIVSFEADPSFDDIDSAGSSISQNDQVHTILDNLFLVSGEIPRVTAYETGLKGGMRFVSADSHWEPDTLITDERFLMCNVKGKGIVMFTGCSHAGVVNSAKHAMSLLGDFVPLHAVVGGFHLATSDSEQTARTIADLKELNPTVLLPGHCTGWRAKFAIEKELPGRLVPCTVGSRIEF